MIAEIPNDCLGPTRRNGEVAKIRDDYCTAASDRPESRLTKRQQVFDRYLTIKIFAGLLLLSEYGIYG